VLPGPPAPHDMFEILGNGVFAFIMTLVEENNFPIPGLINADGLSFLIHYVNQITSDRIVLVFLFIIMAVCYILIFDMLRHMRVLDRGFMYLSNSDASPACKRSHILTNISLLLRSQFRHYSLSPESTIDLLTPS